MLRHKQNKHDMENISSDEEPRKKRPKLEESGSEHEESDSEFSKEEEVEEEEDKEEDTSEAENDINALDIFIDLTFNNLQPVYEQNVHALMDTKRLTEEEAKSRVFCNMINEYRKSLAKCFSNFVMLMNQMKRDPVYRTIKAMVSDLELMEGYGSEEAWSYAISKRKFLFEKVLRRYEAPELKEEPELHQSTSNNQTGGQKSSNAVQMGENWAKDELDRITTAPRFCIIGKKY